VNLYANPAFDSQHRTLAYKARYGASIRLQTRLGWTVCGVPSAARCGRVQLVKVEEAARRAVTTVDGKEPLMGQGVNEGSWL